MCATCDPTPSFGKCLQEELSAHAIVPMLHKFCLSWNGLYIELGFIYSCVRDWERLLNGGNMCGGRRGWLEVYETGRNLKDPAKQLCFCPRNSTFHKDLQTDRYLERIYMLNFFAPFLYRWTVTRQKLRRVARKVLDSANSSGTPSFGKRPYRIRSRRII